jgi:uncharacterized membrane protein
MRRCTAVLAAVAANLPWIMVWVRAGRDATQLDAYVTALFLLLTVGAASAVVLPCLLLPGLAARRWFLIALLVLVNIFWPLRWIDLHASNGAGYPGPGAGVTLFLGLMLASSAAAAVLYVITGLLVGLVRRRAG